jgi:hypothetical protein
MGRENWHSAAGDARSVGRACGDVRTRGRGKSGWRDAVVVLPLRMTVYQLGSVIVQTLPIVRDGHRHLSLHPRLGHAHWILLRQVLDAHGHYIPLIFIQRLTEVDGREKFLSHLDECLDLLADGLHGEGLPFWEEQEFEPASSSRQVQGVRVQRVNFYGTPGPEG